MPLYLRYYFWLLLFSGVVFALERLFPWRRDQKVFRDGFVQDLYWMALNTQFISWMLAIAAVHFVTWTNQVFFHAGLPQPDSIRLIAGWSWWQQFVVFFLLQDFMEWNVHRLLHLVPWGWRFHQLHHSTEQLDWASAFRAHWGEIAIYKVLLYLPLVILGVDDSVIFAIVASTLLLQELIHANLSWDWGPLRYVINSPRLHAWHHSVELHGRGGQNFGISLAIWDLIFGTFYWPGSGQPPQHYGFEGMHEYPRHFWGRLWTPFHRRGR